MTASAARTALAVLTGLLVTAGLLATTTAPAHAGQVGVTIQMQGAGVVRVVEGTLGAGDPTECHQYDNQDDRVFVSCPRIRSEAAFEAWVWLQADPALIPKHHWRFERWSGCDQLRIRDGYTECGVHSGAFTSDERYPRAHFRDVIGPTLGGVSATQVADHDRRFALTFASDGATDCRVQARTAWAPCSSGDELVLPEGRHVLEVRASDPSGNQTFGTTGATSVDTRIATGPVSYANVDTASFRLQTVGGDSFWCSVDGKPFTSCGTGTDTTVALGPFADGPHSLRVQARSGTWVDPVPAVWRWEVDTVAPSSRLTPTVDGTSARFVLDSDGLVNYQCRLDTPTAEGSWEWCHSPHTVTDLAQGEHTFSVRAWDYAGNVQEVPATHRWTVDTVAPTSRLVTSAAADRASFTFTAPGAVSFECRLTTPTGTREWTGCTSPTTYTGLAPGRHRFEVRATDGAGNVETTPASHEWTATAPVVVDPPPQLGHPVPDTGTGSGKAASTTKAAWKVSAARKGRVTLTVSSSVTPTGRVVIKDKGRVIAKTVLKASHRGRVVVRLPKLRRGKHVLVAAYGGSTATAGSTSAKRSITLR